MSPNLSSDVPCVELTQTGISTCRHVQWPTMQVALVNVPQRSSIDGGIKAPRDGLIAPERSERDAGERPMAGLPTSTLYSLGGRLTVIAATHEFEHRQWPPYLTCVRYFPADRPVPSALPARGGLSGWRRKRVTDFIEDHLAEPVRLSTLATMVDLSPYHFVRAFRQSFGVPPHRYHIGRRIERAKALLAVPANSVTTIARGLGFAETSSFSATFRRFTGCSPSEYRRGLG